MATTDGHGGAVAVQLDYTDDNAVARFFDRVGRERGGWRCWSATTTRTWR
jgi:hypothetical protein